ncbi:MAG: hypothetical protein A2087_14535 [Spirochaetes bacterium GWD1_61_31]|nr:MAG: hypothetical protein A2Y37_11005 [Spirochaetes bacterium GWB1_60_80]OHD33701.1 MAG: hypothetical protein A2004_09685 [Spirochaetes bacterium GWC1_61_12]OHD37303.1 MAG: hypothetical protein A2087_14535 [Spirochaetes bacterium GWD1_61_31]OHD44966.1 MAG: hypothetical protein A2Y35_13050 [Spirochaetes bacterium GWE1_60_18]OHD60075.1 MAG: hypothetical protein A2Y32_11160 [Spirochaetes bacterium GWF1_60_12]HAP43638.1 polysaccharide lyase [Spirochaetaceae bacterium]
MFILIPVIMSCCTTSLADDLVQENRVFESSFEAVSDFDGFYMVPPGDYDSSHELSTEVVHDGTYSHKAWILSARAANNDGAIYLPHRAYPTIQLYKTSDGRFVTPCLVSFWAYLDMALVDKPAGSIDDWFSFATLSPDDSDNWVRTVVVNITPDGYLRLVHVPDQGEQEYIFQASTENDPAGSKQYPYRQWVKIDIFIDFSASGGYAKLWQNGVLTSHAWVNGGNGTLAQAHFGLYAAAAVPSGAVYNDQLSIMEISDEAAALQLIE